MFHPPSSAIPISDFDPNLKRNYTLVPWSNDLAWSQNGPNGRPWPKEDFIAFASTPAATKAATDRELAEKIEAYLLYPYIHRDYLSDPAVRSTVDAMHAFVLHKQQEREAKMNVFQRYISPHFQDVTMDIKIFAVGLAILVLFLTIAIKGTRVVHKDKT